MTGQPVVVRQIFYDRTTRAAVRPGYVPLDNSDGPAGWFEFGPMLAFLRETDLEEGVWYGVVSPKFPEKAEITQGQIAAVLARDPKADVALFSYDWASLASELNPWTQGERYHPGLIACMQDFLLSEGQVVDLTQVIADLDTSVMSNYFFAKRSFWRRWRDLAERYLAYVEAGGDTIADNRPTGHRDGLDYSLRVFVQERLVCWLLLTNDIRVVRPDYVADVPLPAFSPFHGRPACKPLLRWCDASKRSARKRGRSGRPLAFRIAVKLLWQAQRFQQHR